MKENFSKLLMLKATKQDVNDIGIYFSPICGDDETLKWENNYDEIKCQ